MTKYTERTPAQGGFNIEGAAWTQENHLLLSLRSPTKMNDMERPSKLQEDAVMLRLKNPAALFAKAGDVGLEDILLNLEGKGIRGLYYDPSLKGCWILAGLSPNPNDDTHDTRT